MSATPLSLTQALQAIGKAVPLVASGTAWTTTQNQFTALGETEGPITVTGSWNVNGLQAIEHTGGILHQARVTPGDRAVTLPIIVGTASLWDLISPTGDADGVADNPVAVSEKALWLVPLSVWDGIASIAWDGATQTPADLATRVANALFFPRGFFTTGDESFPFDNGGKVINSVTYRPMFYGAGATGKKAWIRGWPPAKGLTAFRV